jgi:hypothetical protein
VHLFFAGENFSQVEGFYAGVLTVQCSLKMHETAVVGGCAGAGTGVENGGDLLLQHGVGNGCVLDGEGSSEAAALLDAVEFNEIDSADGLQEAQRAIAERQAAEAMTTGVVGDAMREIGADVLEAEVFGEELGEFEHSGKKSFDVRSEAGIANLCCHPGVVIAHHGDAGRRRDDDDLGCPELVNEALEQGQSFRLVAGIPMHLATTGLAGREIDGMTEPLENTDYGYPCGWE